LVHFDKVPSILLGDDVAAAVEYVKNSGLVVFLSLLLEFPIFNNESE
jgi:hypothetical protein